MGIKYLVIIFLFQISFTPSFSQKTSCKSVQEGKFKVVTKEIGITFINRTASQQIEKNNQIGYELLFDIKWVDECTYELRLKKVIRGDPALMRETGYVIKVKIKGITEKTYIAETSSNFDKTVTEYTVQRLD